jgi:hypothetical protein
MDRSSFAAELCQHRNNTVAVPGCPCANPLTRPFDTDTDTDSDPDPELALPLSFSTVRAGKGFGCKKSIFSTTDSHRFTQIVFLIYVHLWFTLRDGIPIRPIIVAIEIGIDLCPVWHLALMDRSSFAAELCQHRNNTVAVPGCPCANPLTRPFDTDTDSDPDPDLALPLSFSTVRAGKGFGCKKSIFSTTDSHRFTQIVFLICVHLCPSVVHSAGRYPDPSDHCRDRNRNRNRDRSLPCMAPGPDGSLKLRGRVVSAPQQYGCGTRLPMCESPHASIRYRYR